MYLTLLRLEPTAIRHKLCKIEAVGGAKNPSIISSCWYKITDKIRKAIQFIRFTGKDINLATRETTRELESSPCVEIIKY